MERTKARRNGTDLTWQRRTCEYLPSCLISWHRDRVLEECSLETDDDPPLPALFNLKHLNNRSTPPLDLIHDFLVDVDSVVRSLVEESSVRNTSDIR